MPLRDGGITVTGGGPDIPDGVYTLVLTEMDGPKTITPQRGPNAGQNVTVYDWTFEIMDGDYGGTQLRGTTSGASGPRSKMYAWLTALLGGVPPQEGDKLTEAQLLGQVVLGTVQRDDGGWPRIESLAGLPAHMRQQAFAQQMGLPTQPPAQRPAPAARQQPAGRPTAARGGPQAAQRPQPAGYAQQAPQQAYAGEPPQDSDDLPF